MYLVAIVPPSNIQRIICDYQISLFRQGFSPAALALPPHIPLAFYEAPPSRPCNLVQQTPLQSGGLSEVPPWLLLQFHPEGELERLRSCLPEASSTPWYPAGRSALLSRNSHGTAVSVDEPPKLQWKTSHLVCLELEVENRSLWWESIEFTEVWRVKLKRKIG